jgi:hypothetical protein
MRNALRVGVATAFLVLTAAARGDNPPPPIKEISIDLSNRTTGGVLPFDVPFAFTGTASKSVQKIEARSIVVPADKLPLNTLACNLVRTNALQEIPRSEIDGRNDIPRALIWQRDALTPATDTIAFRLVVPPLDAERHYVFDFLVTSSVSPDKLKIFTNRVRKVLDARFRDFGSQEILKTQFPAMRDELRKQLMDAAGKCAEFDAPGTPLSPNAAWEDIGRDFQNFLSVGVERQRKVEVSLRKHDSSISTFNGLLNQVVAAAAKVVGSSEVSASERTAHATLVDFVHLGSADLSFVANGADPAAPDFRSQLMDPLSTSEIDTRITGYERSARHLAALRNWMSDLQTAGTLKKLVDAGTISQDERNALISASGALAMAEQSATVILASLLNLRPIVSARDANLDELVNALQLSALDATSLTTSTLGTYDTFANYHVAADAGFAYVPGLETAVPYVGANFYFRPVNRDAPLRSKGGFGRRFSINLGVSNSVARSGRRSDLFSSQSLIVGAGYRLTDIFRAGVGVVVFQREDPNPLISHKRLAASPYAALSFDFSLAKSLKGIGGLFP